MAEAFIIDAVRTPRGRRKGVLSGVHPVDLLTYPLNSVVERNKIQPEAIEDVAIGCVTQVTEQAWCIARRAVLAAGWPDSVPGHTVNRLCGSSQQTTNAIANAILAGAHDLAIAGGVEHMTRVPMFADTGGEESPLLLQHHPEQPHQGLSAEMICKEYKLTRTQLDEFAVGSQEKAQKAIADGKFKKSLVAVPYTDESGNAASFEVDDNPRPGTTVEVLAGLNPAFDENGVITAGNASAIVDGASVVLLASENGVKEHGLTPRARIVATKVIGSDPKLMLTGPIEASKQVLQRANLKADDIALWEINEAFAPIPLITIAGVGIDPAKVNVNGGAIALGHPLGATGSILVGTLIDELEARKERFGVVTMCIGLGMGIATVIENLSA